MATQNQVLREISGRESRAVRMVDFLRKKLTQSEYERAELWVEVRRLRALVRELKVKSKYMEGL